MDKTATLDKLKATEEEIRKTKREAAELKERILRDARKEALEILEDAKREAEAEYEAYVKSVEEDAAKEREVILAKGRREAEAVRARAQERLDLAVAHLVRRFEDGVLHATAQGDE
jgi:vacuolar-type H+-ATPase subunit H